MITGTTSSEIFQLTTAFISQVLSKPELRHHLFSALRRGIPPSHVQSTLKALNLATEAIENAISAAGNPSIQSSSLQLAESLLLSGRETPFSSFLLSLVHSLCNRPTNASLSLLQIFHQDPSLARADIASCLFEELFLVHLQPVFQLFDEERARILSFVSKKSAHDDHSLFNSSEVVPREKSLSKMTENQASELKELELTYEEALDENCKVLAQYFKEVLQSNDGDSRLVNPPLLVLRNTRKREQLECIEDEKIQQEIDFRNGRYNPIWGEGERSVEFCGSTYSSSSKSGSPTYYPQRVYLNILENQNSNRLNTQPALNSDSEFEHSADDNSANYSSSDSEAEIEEKNKKMAFSETRKGLDQKQQQPDLAESSRSPNHLMTDTDNPPGLGKYTTPKDFVCPITSHLFDDPVTLETGQTYERRAIQEWLDRGNSTCPITRQKLHSTQLPKTNYVLKRLIASWQEQEPGSVSHYSGNGSHETEMTKIRSNMPATSPNSVISQAAINGSISELCHAITKLCVSEILEESEMAVLQIERFWQEADMELDIQSMVSKPPVINGFMEILFNSINPRVLKATVSLLSELGSRDNTVLQTLTQVDSDVECIMALFKKGLLEAVVLIYLLRPSTMTLIEMQVTDSLLVVVQKKDDDLLQMGLKPKTASIILLRQILGSSEESIVSSVASTIVSSKGIDGIIGSLEAEWTEERIAAVGILRRCMQEEGKCRNTIADKAKLAPVLESFTTASDAERFEIVDFLSELVKLNRRTSNEQILHIIRDHGAFSMMHTLLVFLQTALEDQIPSIAGLLLQLDLLAEPRKMSIYREEAIDNLISCLRNSSFPAAQIAAAETIVSLQGRFTSTGKPLTRAFLLKHSGLDKSYEALMRMEQLSNISGDNEDNLEEEKAADDWERKMSFVLVSHEFGLLFEALAEGFKSKYAELHSASFIAACWLIQMLEILPDTGVRGAARVCLLQHFISTFKSVKDTEDRSLAVLALNSFLHDSEGLCDLASHMKDIMKGLRELRRSSPLALEMLKVLSEGHETSADLWSHKELVQVDSSENGEVLSIVCFKDKIFSGHSNGTIKIWTGRGSILHLLEEVREHTKAVTTLAVLQSGEKLYSGSLDRTIRVWSIGNDGMHCVQVHDLKDQVYNLVVANSISCFIPQGAGIKVHSWSGQSKLLNQNKDVKCMTLIHGKLYCGCHDSSIQEIDLATGTFSTVQSGSRKLLGKANPVHALQVYDGLIYAACSALDGAVVKIWNASNFSMMASLQTTLEARVMVMSSELVYLGCKGGAVEIWDRKKHSRIETLQTGTNARVLCMALDSSEEVLVIGTSDGRIQAWGLD